MAREYTRETDLYLERFATETVRQVVPSSTNLLLRGGPETQLAAFRQGMD